MLNWASAVSLAIVSFLSKIWNYYSTKNKGKLEERLKTTEQEVEKANQYAKELTKNVQDIKNRPLRSNADVSDLFDKL